MQTPTDPVDSSPKVTLVKIQQYYNLTLRRPSIFYSPTPGYDYGPFHLGPGDKAKRDQKKARRATRNNRK